jgi:glycosyltransferase involved in cell wall biosynthesis
MDKLSVLILTHNEEKNIRKCVESILPLTKSIFIVDSGSDDNTLDIARSYGVRIAARKWTTHADQFNWGLDHFEFSTDWIMRMDADEEVTDELVHALRAFLDSPPAGISGIYIRRRVFFLGRWIKHGGYYPTWLLRIFRKGLGRCEAVHMDEHILVSQGGTLQIKADIIDYNNKDLTFWTDKHNKYSNLEVAETLRKRAAQHQGGVLTASLTQSQAHSRRWVKENIYGRTPLFVRPFMYFIYRYFIRLGFLDGRQGLVFHFLQGFWYRFLVDAKLYEHKLKARDEKKAGTL